MVASNSVQAAEGNRGKDGRWFWCALVVLLIVVIAVMVLVVTRADTLYDEGGYLYEGWLVVAKGWQPYADFHTKTLPLLYYVYGVWQAVVGPSVLVGRIGAAGFALASLLLMAGLARRLSGPWAAVLVVGLFAFNLHAAVQYYRCFAIAPTAFFVVLALYLVTIERPKAWQLYAGGLATAGVLLCRHDMIAVVIVLWVYLYLRHRGSSGHAVGALAVSVGLVVAAGVYFYVRAPVQFSNVIFMGLFTPSLASSGPTYSTAVKATPGAMLWHLMMFLRWYTAPLLLLAPAVGYVVYRAREETGALRKMLARHSGVALLLGVAAANYLSHVAGSVCLGLNVYYMLDFYIFLPIAGAAGASLVLAARVLRTKSCRAQLAALAVIALVVPLWVAGVPDCIRFSGETHLQQIATGAAAIRRIVPEDASIFTVDDPHQFLAAGREVFPELTHQLFRYTDSADTEAVRLRHKYNREMIAEWLSGEAQYAVVSDELLGWMVGSARYQDGVGLRDFMMSRIEDNYTLVETVEGSYHGPTRIYKYEGKRY